MAENEKLEQTAKAASDKAEKGDRGKKLSRMNFLNLYLKGDRTFYGKGFYTF